MIGRSLFFAGLTAACLLPVSFSASAEDLGVYGNVVGIAEQDAIDMIKGKLKEMEKKGELKKLEEKFKAETISQLTTPAPIPGYTPATAPRTWTFDPSWTFSQTVTDGSGNVIAPAGTRVNPLEQMALTKRLIFIDARIPKEVEWAKKQKEANPRDKVILVAGSWVPLMEAWKTPVYFDQQGTLTKRFGLSKTPSVVSQAGKVLKIEEVAL